MTLEFERGAPYSTQYQDVYFSRDGGLEEARHVFLAANDLPNRWIGAQTFTIAEAGFGTGLSFLATWQLWQETAPPGSRLHFLSIEKHPLANDALARCHAMFPELSDLSASLLIALAETPLEGFHRILLQDGRVTLTLCHGDVVAMLRGLKTDVDCWFLDGFAPAKNPQMWSEPVFREIARLSHPGTTFATFTSAGRVRRGLSEQGFRVEKQPGYGRKREMCSGTFLHKPEYRPREPWFSTPRTTFAPRAALVIGSGIAGAQVAYHLAKRGWSVRVLERHSRPALEASGNPAAVFSPFLTTQPSLEEQFSLQCFTFLLQQLSRLDTEQAFHQRCGVLALSLDRQREERAAGIVRRGLPGWLVSAVDRKEADALSGLETGNDGLFHPLAGWINPARWIDCLLNTEGIALQTGSKVTSLHPSNGNWHARDASGQSIASAPVAVIASGRFMEWAQCRWLPFTPVAGQTTFLDAAALPGSPRCVVRHDGYLIPIEENRHLIGATYQRQVDHGMPDPAADDANLASLANALPGIMAGEDGHQSAVTTAHSAIRMTSENRLPLVGALADPDVLMDEYPRMLRRSYQFPVDRPVYLPGLYLSAAWGSRGMTNAALGGELLASLICAEPAPLQADLMHAIHPSRSLVRGLKRGAA